MISKLTKNIFSAAGQTIVQMAILMVLYRYLIDRLGIEQLGIWSVVLATASATRVSELGLGGSITKFVAAYRSQGNDKAAAEALQTAAVSVGVLFGIIILIAYPLLLWALPHVLPTAGLDEGRAILPYGIVSLWLTSVASMWTGGLDACLHSEMRAVIMITGSLLFFLLSLLTVPQFGLVGLAAAQVAQGLFLVVLGWIVLRRVMPSLPVLPLLWKASCFREMLGYGVNFQINSIVLLLFEPTTKILLGRYGGLSAAGYFEMAQRLVIKVRALVVESNRVIVPVYAGMGSYKSDAPSLYTQNMHYLLFIIMPVFAALIAITPAISELWVGSFELQFIIIALSIASAWFLNTLSAPAYFAYLGQGKLRWVTMAHIVMGTINVFFGIFLGRLFGWQGVIAAFVGSLFLGSLIPICAYHIEHHISFIKIMSMQDLMFMVVCFGAAVISIVSYWFVINIDFFNKWVRTIGSISVIGIVMIITVWYHPLRRQFFNTVKAHFLK